VQGLGSSVTAAGCTANSNAHCGMYVCDGASAELRECTLQDNSVGLKVQAKGSKARALLCLFRGNTGRGFQVWAGEGEGERCASTDHGTCCYAAGLTRSLGTLRLAECTSSDGTHEAFDTQLGAIQRCMVKLACGTWC
jgi:parallel beta-helix repeat protein